MPKLPSIILYLLILSCCGCFEILEEIDHNNDGSGNFSYLVNMSSSKERLSTLLSLDTVSGLRVPKKEDIERQFEKGIKLVRSAPGISQVSIERDYENFIFTIKFHYDSIAALNRAAGLIHAQMSPYGNPYREVFQHTENGWNRQIDAHSGAFLANLKKKNPAMLKEATYTTVYRFNHTVSSPNSDAKIAGNQRAIMYRYNMAELASQPNKMQQRIILK